MLRALVVLLFLSLAGVASSQRQHALHSDKDKYYNITLDVSTRPILYSLTKVFVSSTTSGPIRQALASTPPTQRKML